MAINRRIYPKDWERLRLARLELVDYRCEDCGMRDGTERTNPHKPHPLFPEGKPSRMWLQLHHIRQYRTWDRESETIVLCPICHRAFERKNVRKMRSQFAPLGVVWVWVHHQGERLLACEGWTYDDLLEVIGSFEPGKCFDLEVDMLRQVVGSGCYCRLNTGVQVLAEEGVCTNFGLFLDEIFAGVVG